MKYYDCVFSVVVVVAVVNVSSKRKSSRNTYTNTHKRTEKYGKTQLKSYHHNKHIKFYFSLFVFFYQEREKRGRSFSGVRLCMSQN